ncbi:MAG: ShlB/FhaC/HecB family hemolysin secretion/activation protein [Veillonellales bacterium]
MSKQRTRDKRTKVCGAALSVFCLLSPVAALAAEAPDAGKTLEELKRPELNLPQKQEEKIQIEEAYRPPIQGDRGERFPVKGFRITGQTVFSETELLRLIADGTGEQVSLADLEKLAGRITDYYHRRGYMMARAYVPAQRLENGIAEIAVIVGRYDQIIVRKKTGLSDTVISRELGTVKAGRYIEKDALDKALWLMTDLAGVEAKATLAPGNNPGTSNLILDINPKGETVSGSIGVDNYGNRFTGKNEISTSVTVLNPSQQGDLFSFYGVTTGGGLASGSISYQLPFQVQGGKLELNYSRMHYELGNVFSSLNASGTADTTSIAYDCTFHRSRMANLYGQVNYSYKKLQDTVSGTTTDKHSDIVAFTLNGDSMDSWGGGGANSYSLSYSRGKLHAGDSNSRQAGTPGSFGKWNMTTARQQYINDRLSMVSVFNGQIATRNLDSSEKLSLGGPYGVRAYPKGEASGDKGYLFSSELHWSLPIPHRPSGSFQLVGFYDLGSVAINKDPLPGSGANHRTLQGAGLGMVWTGSNNLTAKVHYAWKIGSGEARSDTDKNGRLWVQVTKRF